jgi:Tfp pilus assembly protein PilN
MKQRRYEDLRGEIRTVFTTTLPEVKNIVNEVQQLRSKIQEVKKGSLVFLEAGGEGMSMLDLMREITVRIPDDVKVDVKDLVIDRGRVAITGETDSFESVDKIRTGLQGFTGFKRVGLTHAKVGAKGDKVEFKVSISMEEGRSR